MIGWLTESTRFLFSKIFIFYFCLRVVDCHIYSDLGDKGNLHRRSASSGRRTQNCVLPALYFGPRVRPTYILISGGMEGCWEYLVAVFIHFGLTYSVFSSQGSPSTTPMSDQSWNWDLPFPFVSLSFSETKFLRNGVVVCVHVSGP